MHRLIKKAMVYAALALLLCGLGAGAARAATQKIILDYKIYLGNAKTVSDNALKEKPADLLRFFSPLYNRDYYFVLPAEWDPSDLRIFFSDVSSVTIGGKTYKNGDHISLELNKTVALKPAKKSKINLTVTQTGGLPAVYIKTQSGGCTKMHADKSHTEPGHMYMLDAQGNKIYEGDLSAMRIRGNSTIKYDKKPYQIKLKEAYSLLGTKKDKTYILLANTLDRSQIRNTVGLSLARYSKAFSFVPAFQSVDLFLNNDYKGTYLLTEKVEIDSDRLDITNLEDAIKKLNPKTNFAKLKAKGPSEYRAGAKKFYTFDKEPEDYTGGYLLQSNLETRYATEMSAFVTKKGFPFTLQEPKYATKKEVQYLANLFQSVENALFSKNGVDPATKKHYTKLIDLNTFVNKYLLAEVLDDYDGQRCYFYKDSDRVDPMLYVGPVWDLDNILGACANQTDPAKLHLANDHQRAYYWFTQAAKHKDFSAAAINAYNNTYRRAINILLGKEKDPEGILKSIDEYAAEVRTSAKADLVRWPNKLRNAYPNFNTKSGSSFTAQVDFIKNYLAKRQTVLNKAFPASSQTSKQTQPAATAKPTAEPTPEPTAAPAAEPTPEPTAAPAAEPTPEPTAAPTAEPTPELTAKDKNEGEENNQAQSSASAKDMYTTYKLNSEHIGVYPLRKRLHQLGYLEKLMRDTYDRAYTYDSRMVKAVRAFQKANGLEVNGVASPSVQALIYSDSCKSPKKPPSPTPVPDQAAKATTAASTPALPALDAEGFLPEDSTEEYLYNNEKNEGLWYYISNNLYVEIRKFVQKKPALVWFETRVRMRGDMAPDSIFSRGKQGSVKEENPADIAQRAKAVLAISDDFYAYRVERTFKPGIIIRNGILEENKVPTKPSIFLFPRIDIMAFLPDGTMGVWERGKITAKELQDMGVQNSYSFGPVLIKDGKETVTARYNPASLHYGNEPRNAIGMLAPNDYLIITVKGRSKDSEGAGIPWVLDRFLYYGAQSAFNLDGGGTSCVAFMGEILNKNEKTARGINSMIRFGSSDLVKAD